MTQNSPIYDAIVAGAGVSGTATHGFRHVLIQISPKESLIESEIPCGTGMCRPKIIIWQ